MRKIGIIVALMMILSSIMVFGAATMRAPLASGTITTTTADYVLNVTLAAGDVKYTQCNFTAYSTSTATTTATVIDTVTNTSGNQLVFEGSFNSTTLEDSNDWVFGAACTNETTALTVSVTGVTVDNTEPTAATSLSPSDDSTDDDGDITFSATMNDATTTGCTLHFDGSNPGRSSYAMTYATTSCTLSFTNVANGQYDWYVRATDGTDTTDSATTDLAVSRPGKYGGAARVSGGPSQGMSNATKLVLLIVIGVGAWLYLKKK